MMVQPKAEIRTKRVYDSGCLLDRRGGWVVGGRENPRTLLCPVKGATPDVCHATDPRCIATP